MLQQIYDKNKKNKQSGYVVLLGVLILGAMAGLIIPTMILLGIDNYKTSFDLENSQKAIELARSCGEEAIIKLQKERLNGELIVYPVDDTFVTSSQVSNNFGKSEVLNVDSTQKSLIRFDLSTIPDTVTITSAKISLYATASVASSSYSVHAISSGNNGWIEGNRAVETAGPLQPSWSYKDTGNLIAWVGSAGLNSAGTDYTSGAEDSYMGALVVDTRYEWDLNTSLVQGWLITPNSNSGLLIRTSSANTAAFASKENIEPFKSPQLIIQYAGDATTSGRGRLGDNQNWCYYNVVDLSGENREIRVKSFVRDIVRKVKVSIDQLSPKINVTSWQEVADF